MEADRVLEDEFAFGELPLSTSMIVGQRVPKSQRASVLGFRVLSLKGYRVGRQKERFALDRQFLPSLR